ncbi:CPBP family intramembrane glutamic endopeptidase [Levilactobacillus enshiensis]|uniref:CPBP family intramembrane glutamic endopeptidase n=1 Tax=Levilactobacillus enshiensis TaxID=2590213 RepID=UPI00117ADEE6|nr:CPBP family intramembrane glutamic endopeptidase [Levilactobacillus enshiensis]
MNLSRGKWQPVCELVVAWIVLLAVMSVGILFEKLKLTVTTSALLEEITVLLVLWGLNHYWLKVHLQWRTDQSFGTQVRVNAFSLVLVVLFLASLEMQLAHGKGVKHVVVMALVALLVAVFEETFFRGVLLVGFLQRIGRGDAVWLAVLLSSTLFAASHLINLLHQPVSLTIAQVLMAFGFGLLQSATYLRSGSLIWPILLHFVLDTQALTRDGLMANTHVPAWSGFMPLVVYGIVALILLRRSKRTEIVTRFKA